MAITNDFTRPYLRTIVISIILICEPASSLKTSDIPRTEKGIWKKCCLNNSPDNDNDHCTDIDPSWDLLKQYRVPNEGSVTAPVHNKMERTKVFQDQLSCKYTDDKVLRFAVPVWKQNNGTLPPSKGFVSFFSPDGHLQYHEYTYSPEQYCIESTSPEEVTVVACDYTSSCSRDANSKFYKDNKMPCLYRCCNYGEVWNIISGRPRCMNSGEHKWKFPLYSDLSSTAAIHSEINKMDDENPVYYSVHPRTFSKNCKSPHTFEIPSPDFHKKNEQLSPLFGGHAFKVLANGTVWMNLRNEDWIQLDPGEYCVDGFQLGEGTYSGNDVTDSLLFECKVLETAEEVQAKERQRKYSLTTGIIIFICVLFLLMTIVVYVLLWSKHNIHGWTVFSYITTLLFTYLLLGTSHFATVLLVREHRKLEILTFCGLLGVFSHFSFLCTFAWSTVLSFDLFCTFRTLRPTRHGKSSGLKKFLFYCIFALMVPSIIVSIGILLDITYDAEVRVVTPKYGKSVCYVEPQYARFYYVILPIAILLGINFLLFCNTAFSVYKVKKSTQFASSSSTKKESDNQTLRLILKLLLVNGAVWVAEIISWYLQHNPYEVGIFSFILDVVDIMQAVAIFFLFVFKNDILEALRRKYPALESTVNTAFLLKNLGSTKRSGGNATTSTDTSYNVKVNENLPVSSL